MGSPHHSVSLPLHHLHGSQQMHPPYTDGWRAAFPPSPRADSLFPQHHPGSVDYSGFFSPYSTSRVSGRMIRTLIHSLRLFLFTHIKSNEDAFRIGEVPDDLLDRRG